MNDTVKRSDVIDFISYLESENGRNLRNENLMGFWEDFERDPEKTKKEWDKQFADRDEDKDNLTVSNLKSMTVVNLKEICRSKKLKVSGTKSVLIERIRSGGDATVVSANAKPAKKPLKKSIIKKIKAESNKIIIKRNVFNNYVHVDSQMVFDGKKKLVIGKQRDDGTVSELSREDIDICNKYGLDYEMPSDLDKNLTLENVKVDELDELEEDTDEDINEDELKAVEEEDEDEFDEDAESLEDE